MSNTLYLQTEQNVLVRHSHISLQDIVQLSCTDTKALNRLRVMPVLTLSSEKKGRYVLSALDLIHMIQEKEPNLTICHIGEADFIVTYEPKKNAPAFFQWLKILFVCLISFFGGGFSIMTFNNDVNLSDLFQKLYFQITGTNSDGFTLLEISYSIGIGVGILFFFNHFSHKRFSSDPTPMQIKMHTYETEVNTTLIQDANRESS